MTTEANLVPTEAQEAVENAEASGGRQTVKNK